ncbi:hypothetical protein C0J52_21731 [Blattella germanica]|nr:hypothetical protein C0J52_21731 [Blattella germanica]
MYRCPVFRAQPARELPSESAHNPGNMGPENVANAVALNEDGRSIRYISNVLSVTRNTCAGLYEE